MHNIHTHAEATYRTIPLPNGSFSVEVVIPETYPTTVTGLATEADASAWIVRHKNQVEAGTPTAGGLFRRHFRSH
jgi:hypothetical protein